MKALILKGRYKGQVTEIQQWCNDWFSVEVLSDKGEKRIIILSPVSLAFTQDSMDVINKHHDNGMLFVWYKLIPSDENNYPWTFIKHRGF